MSKKNGAGLVSMLLIVLLMFITIPNAVSYVSESETAYQIAAVPHDPFVINGDTNFSDTALAEGWTGDGSSESPYIIENLDIDLGPSPTVAINITDTRVHFIIRNCRLTGPAATPSYGILFENVTNAQIVDSEVTEFSHAVIIREKCTNVLVSGNNCSFNSYAIYMHDGNSNTISDNLCNSNFFYGIFIHSTNSSIVADNTCNENDMSGIYVYNCSSNSVSGNTCNYNDFGLYLQELGSHNVTWNTCRNNSHSGIAFNNCDMNDVSNNTAANNTVYGVYLYVAADNNDVHWNVWANNTSGNGYDTSTGNVFFNNFWSDYSGVDNNQDGIGDTGYSFFGNSDPSPLMYYPWAPEWKQMLTDQVIELGNNFEYAFEFIIISYTAPYDLSISDEDNFVISDQLPIDNNTRRHSVNNWIALPVGIYPLIVTASNIYGVTTERSFTLSVVDTTPPTLTSPDDISYVKGESPPEILWVASDLSLISYIVLLDGSELTSSNGVISTSVSFSMILEDKEPGVYNYTMVAEDEWGNVAVDTVIVTVNPVPLLETLLPLLFVGAIATIVIIVALVYRKRKAS
ncbi:MAG: right-handed parallel beta-helix repeat-containing protein [Candidatus Thorarchaeota archaeon]|jgi:parallel beta-helix repeat protein